MPIHQAPSQMLGYLYQVRYALVLLLANEDDCQQISIEKYDDVAFSDDDTPKQLIQLKHHLNSKGNLSDNSTDLWRTIKTWLDVIKNDPELTKTTRFLIITTATAPEDSVAFQLKSENRNVDEIYSRLKSVCAIAGNAAHQSYYESFLGCQEHIVKNLLSKIMVIDCAEKISNLDESILRYIRCSCLQKYEMDVLEKFEGWWFRKVIEALCSEIPTFISYNQARTQIVSISRQYADDTLPIDLFQIPHSFGKEDLPQRERIFLEQLELICCGNHRMKVALRDYYRAFHQRAKWVRDELLYINELDEYEYKLIDEWEHAFADMQDYLCEYGNNPDETTLQRHGLELFQNIQNKDIRIRPLCGDAFIMRGSYHMLANKLKVGWHRDFISRLQHLLMQES